MNIFPLLNLLNLILSRDWLSLVWWFGELINGWQVVCGSLRSGLSADRRMINNASSVRQFLYVILLNLAY